MWLVVVPNLCQHHASGATFSIVSWWVPPPPHLPMAHCSSFLPGHANCWTIQCPQRTILCMTYLFQSLCTFLRHTLSFFFIFIIFYFVVNGIPTILDGKQCKDFIRHCQNLLGDSLKAFGSSPFLSQCACPKMCLRRNIMGYCHPQHWTSCCLHHPFCDVISRIVWQCLEDNQKHACLS